MMAEEDQPGPIGSAAAAARVGHDNARPTNTAADDAYPLDESPEKAMPSVAFAPLEAEVLCTPEDGKKATSNHRAYNALTNPVGDTIGPALLHSDKSGKDDLKNAAAATASERPSAASSSTPSPVKAAATTAVAATVPSARDDREPTTTTANLATPESSPKLSRRLFQAVQAGTALPPSTNTSLNTSMASDHSDVFDGLNNGTSVETAPPPAAAPAAGDADARTPVSAAAAAAAAAAQIRRDVEVAGQQGKDNDNQAALDTSRKERNRKDVVAMALNRRRQQTKEEEVVEVANVDDGGDIEADVAVDAEITGGPTSASNTPPKHPSGTDAKASLVGIATETPTIGSVHHPADESPVKALFRGGKPFQSGSGTPPSGSRSRSRSRSKVSPAKMHFASTAIPSPVHGGGANAEENSSVVGGEQGNNNDGGTSALLDASILADQSFASQGANTFVEDDDDDDNDIADNRTDVSAEVDALDLAGISPIFVRAFGSCGAVGGGGAAAGSRWKKKRQQQLQLKKANIMDEKNGGTTAKDNDRDEANNQNNIIANLREEIDCLKAKVKARDVGIVKLSGELSEATADLKHVRLMLQKEQRRNAAFGGSGTTSGGAGEMSYSYSATTAASADGEEKAATTTATTTAITTAKATEVASYKRQVEKQQEEIRNRDVRLNWMTKKMESLEVERCSLLEQLADETKTTPSPTVVDGGDNTANGNEKQELLSQSESSEPGRIGKADDTVALRLKLHESDSTIAALKAEINTMRSPELYARSQAAEVERLVEKAKRDAATIDALKSENTRLVMEAANGKDDMCQDDTDKAKTDDDPNQSLEEILGEVSRCVDPGAIRGDGPEDEFFGDSLVEDPTIRSMSTLPTDKAKIKSLEKKLREAKELEFSMKSRMNVLSAALNRETSKVSVVKSIPEQKGAESVGGVDKLASTNHEQEALIARLEKDIDDRDKSLLVLRSIIDRQKKEIMTQQSNFERWKKAAKDNLDETADVTMETETSRDVSQEGVEVMEDAYSRVAFSVTKAQDTIAQWMEKLPQCLPDDTQAAFGK